MLIKRIMKGEGEGRFIIFASPNIEMKEKKLLSFILFIVFDFCFTYSMIMAFGGIREPTKKNHIYAHKITDNLLPLPNEDDEEQEEIYDEVYEENASIKNIKIIKFENWKE